MCRTANLTRVPGAAVSPICFMQRGFDVGLVRQPLRLRLLAGTVQVRFGHPDCDVSCNARLPRPARRRAAANRLIPHSLDPTTSLLAIRCRVSALVADLLWPASSSSLRREMLRFASVRWPRKPSPCERIFTHRENTVTQGESQGRGRYLHQFGRGGIVSFPRHSLQRYPQISCYGTREPNRSRGALQTAQS